MKVIRIFEVKTVCTNKENGAPPVNSTYRVTALDGEQAIGKIKKPKVYSNLEKVMSIALVAETTD